MRKADTQTVYRSFLSSVRFFYENGPRLIVLSVIWFICSLPLVTVGPATLGTYTAIISLREEYHFNRGRVAATLKRHGLSAALLSGVPLVFVAITTLYVQQYLRTLSTVTLVLAVVTSYAAAYAALVLVPTFAGLATGVELEPALRAGIRWTGQNATAAVMLGLGTVVLAVATALLTVAFALMFAGIAFSFHLETVLDPAEDDEDEESSRRSPMVTNRPPRTK